MISKQFRLSEREVKKVLWRSKPFFSYGIVLNQSPNRLWYNRYAIVLWAKSVNHNVTRNFFRRRYYEYIRTQLPPLQSFPRSTEGAQRNNYSSSVRKSVGEGLDIVCVVKKQTHLDRKDKNSIIAFDKDLSFLFNKIT